MISHPYVLSILVMDAAALLLYGIVAVPLFRPAVAEPGATDRLRIESAADAARIAAIWGDRLFALSTLLLAFTLFVLMPERVPGAMCGTGVMQATFGLGEKALFLRFAGILLIHVRGAIASVGDASPARPLLPLESRLFLALLPVACVAVWTTGTAFLSLAAPEPVSCCVALYDEIRPAGGKPVWFGDTTILFAFYELFCLIPVLSAAAWRYPSNRPLSVALGVFAATWTIIAAVALTRVFSAGFYGVLDHHCPFCLFLPEHGMAGYPLFGLLAGVLLESAAGLVVIPAARSAPELAAPASARHRRAAVRIVIFSALFTVGSGLPLLIWRLRYGVWLG